MIKHFALCCDDNYAPFACVAAKSIISNLSSSESFQIHIFGNKISEKNIIILKSLSPHINIYDVLGKTSKLLLATTKNWDITAWARLYIPEILPLDVTKVLYIDCDVIINSSLDNLFKIDIRNYSIAACIDSQNYNPDTFSRLNYSPSLGYICSGVLLMNLDYWRKENITNKIVSYAQSHDLQFPDQDAINYVCKDSKLILSPEYGVLVPFFLNTDFIKEHVEIMEDLFYNPKIVHFAGYQPWVYSKNKSAHSSLWWKQLKGLKYYSKIKVEYIKSFFKYLIKFTLSQTGIISKNNPYSIYQYYYHPKITKDTIEKIKH